MTFCSASGADDACGVSDALVGTDADAKEFADKDTMDDNTLLVQKIQAENREKVTKAQKDREKA